MKKYQLYINGQLVPSQGDKFFQSINPSSEEVFAEIADASLEDMQAAIKSAREAFDKETWRDLTVKERGAYLIQIADLIRDNAKELADLETGDTGKTIKQTTFIDVPTCADTFEYFGKVTSQLNGHINAVPAPVKSLTQREPIGVVGGIIPWNYPLIMAAWKMAPALIAGNTVVFRPSSQASVSVMKLAEIIAQVELPKGVLNIVSSKSHGVSAELIKSPLVDKISFTGGTETGREVMRAAAVNTKRLTLELGGKSPNIVFADCDFEAAVGGTMSAIFMNQGQMCTAGSRLLLDEKIHDQFLEELAKKTKALKIGAAADYETDFGPLVNKKHLEGVLAFIELGKKEGATLLCGGKIPEGGVYQKGFYLEPTIFTDVKNSMMIAQEEAFGPVLSVIKFSSVDEAIAIANDSQYGLACCIWTKDLNKASLVSKKIQAGIVWVNTYGGFYNEAPIGGCKQSGFGRELGLEGLLEFTQVKHVCIDETPGGSPLVANWF